MGNFDQKVNKFIEIFWEQNGYNKVLQGLQNTLMIAIAGLIIGIIIGTIIATVRVLQSAAFMLHYSAVRLWLFSSLSSTMFFYRLSV